MKTILASKLNSIIASVLKMNNQFFRLGTAIVGATLVSFTPISAIAQSPNLTKSTQTQHSKLLLAQSEEQTRIALYAKADDPLLVLTSLKDALRGRGGGPLENSSGSNKQVYYQIDIDKFLQTAPIESDRTVPNSTTTQP